MNISIEKVKPSKKNYRTTMDKTELAALAASIREKGILQPIIVRPVNNHYEIVAGHRRYAAAMDNGLDRIPIEVKKVTKEEALEIQLIENTQREDTNPIDEAQGFKDLLAHKGYDAETIAMKIGRAPGYVLSRLKLLDLPEAARKRLINGDITFGQAKLLLRLNKKEQKDFLEEMIRNKESMAQSKERMRRYSWLLSSAPFDTGECGKCSYRSSNQTMLFEEKVPNDECTNRACFKGKALKFYEQLLNEKKEAGFQIITGIEYSHSIYNDARKAKIAPVKSDDWSATVPPRYKSECARCTEHHGYYLTKDHGGAPVFGEVCLKISCLNKQRGMTSHKEPETKKGDRERSDYVHATSCRNRFLVANLPDRVEKSEILRKRLVIYHLVQRYHEFHGIPGVTETMKSDENLMDIMGKYGCKHYDVDEKVYLAVSIIPEAELDIVLYRLTMNMLIHTEPGVLLQMTPEAGIDAIKEFKMDRDFLNTKTKAELCALVKKLKLAITVSDKMKKPAILDEIFKVDLTGQVIGSLKELCRVVK